VCAFDVLSIADDRKGREDEGRSPRW